MNMVINKKASQFSFAVLLICVCDKSNAVIDSDVSLDFPGTTATGGCILSISELEPIRYVNSDCATLEMAGEQVVRQDSNPIANFDIGAHPRSEPFDKTWETFLFNIEPGEQYCQDFGNSENKILLFDNEGEPSGPGGIGFWPGAEMCDNVPAPPAPTVFCYDPPLFLGCPYGCMSSPYLMSWVGQNASSFVVQKQGYFGWDNWYSGPNTSSFASTGTIYDEYFRVKAVNAAGLGSNWCQMSLRVQCSETMDPW